MAEKVWRYCEAQGISGKTVSVKIKHSHFAQATRSRSGAIPFVGMEEVLETANGLLTSIYPFRRPVRLLGVTLSTLTNDRGEDDEEQSELDLDL